MNSNCIICQGQTRTAFVKKIFSKDVDYYLCTECGFLFTERPAYWLSEAYSNAITSLDLGLVNRNLLYTEILAWYIKVCSTKSGKFLDFGGGYGLLTRIMRDKGFDFYRQDNFCDNLFARHFDISDMKRKPEFDIITAFEVFEHLEDPLSEVDRMLELGNQIFFSTETIPDTDMENWYYLLPEIGQHISFYSERSLARLALQKGCFYYKINSSLHIISKNRIPVLKLFLFRKVAMTYSKALQKIRLNNRPSLLMNDFEMVKQKLFKDQNPGVL